MKIAIQLTDANPRVLTSVVSQAVLFAAVMQREGRKTGRVFLYIMLRF